MMIFTEYEWNVSLEYDTHTKAFIRASDFDFHHTNAHQSAVVVAQLNSHFELLSKYTWHTIAITPPNIDHDCRDLHRKISQALYD